MEHFEFYAGLGVQTAVFMVSVYIMVLRNDWSNKALKEDMTSVQQEMKKLAEVITAQAIQSTRIDHMSQQLLSIDKRVEDLRKGDGWITGRRVIGGENHN